MPAHTKSPALLLPFPDTFSDLRVRYGIKLSLSALLSLYVALVLRLEHPNWAVLTTLVMMNSHYVGSTSLKAILRCVGTIAGAFLGVWLVGSYASRPVLFLLFIFIILGIAVYKFGQYPSSQVPYAYYLVGNYNAFVVSLTNLFQAALHLQRKRQEESQYISRIQIELEAVSRAIAQEFQILVRSDSPGARLPETTINEAYDVLFEKLKALRAAGLFVESSIEVDIDFFAHIASLRAIRDELLELRQIKQGLPRLRAAPPERRRAWDLLPAIDWFWMRTAFKAALAAALSLLLIRWIHPPGPAALPIAALLFSVLQRTFIRAGGTGDLRAFQRLFFACIILSVYTALLIAITPFLASYLVMNLTLFVALFIFGFLTARTPGFSFWAIVTVLGTSVFVGLNAQEPVDSGMIIDSVLGLITGMAVATVIGRLIWPLLPQRLLRDDLLEIFAQLKALSNPKQPLKKIQTRLALLPIEAMQFAKRIRVRGFTGEEQRQFELLIRALSSLTERRTALARGRFELPAKLESLVHSELDQLEIEFVQVADAFADCFRKGDCRREFPTVRNALDCALERTRFARSAFSPRKVWMRLSSFSKSSAGASVSVIH
jgi:uncharacterized membrane protein YccC